MKLPVLFVLAALAWPAQSTLAPDRDGFIHDWLVLAPIPLAGQSGADEIDAEFIFNESSPTPAADERASAVGAQDLTWRAHHADDYFVDFLKAFGQVRGEYVLAYAVTYVVADEAMDVQLALGTNDQGKVWLNGTEVFKVSDARGLEKDADRVQVKLAKGRNVLVFKVINETNSWQACARFLRGDLPVTNLRISLAPS
jgi:hypothetical protein